MLQISFCTFGFTNSVFQFLFIVYNQIQHTDEVISNNFFQIFFHESFTYGTLCIFYKSWLITIISNFFSSWISWHRSATHTTSNKWTEQIIFVITLIMTNLSDCCLSFFILHIIYYRFMTVRNNNPFRFITHKGMFYLNVFPLPCLTYYCTCINLVLDNSSYIGTVPTISFWNFSMFLFIRKHPPKILCRSFNFLSIQYSSYLTHDFSVDCHIKDSSNNGSCFRVNK